jgi:hypothetical protein
LDQLAIRTKRRIEKMGMMILIVAVIVEADKHVSLLS